MSFTNDFLNFLNEACSPFHAVDACRSRYIGAGFIELKETDDWVLNAGFKYFFVRNGTTIVAFSVGSGYKAGNGITCVGAHTDSPCLRIKPATCSTKSDILVLNTQPYGGGLWHTWFDRDLGIAGRVFYKDSNDVISSKLVRIDSAIARIPTLAIHLTSGSERDSFAPNLQDNAKAVLTTNIELINSQAFQGDLTGKRLHPALTTIIATALEIDPNSILDMELQLIDIQPSTTGGLSNEFIFSGRLDNLCSSYQAMRALIDSSTDEHLADQSHILMVLYGVYTILSI